MSNEAHDFEREHRQQTQGQQPGGRASRGPAVNPGGKSEPQGPTPPYEGRKQRADTTEHPRPPRAGDEDLSGAGGIRSSSGEEQPSSLGANAGTSPADEQPAFDYAGQTSDYEGVGPAHTPGVSRGEQRAASKTEEELEQKRKGPGINPDPLLDPEHMPDTGPADQGH